MTENLIPTNTIENYKSINSTVIVTAETVRIQMVLYTIANYEICLLLEKAINPTGFRAHAICSLIC